ncbi:MAG: response regulator [Proteobacteria bacterium]|nr:response regulator [Desulfobacteraceae bacterium]MBU4012964.1 response regulator [Pseudomonadota bacterium]MBU4066962.1 response regulator [Pseudomonadota bacterium]MBU4100448.1 response regulator [Pseudomonadota bacterium]MBU4127304.1 response regulator [Pseudomonadota bacterium]
MRRAIRSNVKIVVVDDDKLTRDLMVNALMYCVNRDVLSFENGFSALAYLDADEDSLDIIVSDVDMPEMSGLALLESIKKKWPSKICIIMSENPANEKSASDLGADAFLAKPFKVTDLFKIVQEYIVDAE